MTKFIFSPVSGIFLLTCPPSIHPLSSLSLSFSLSQSLSLWRQGLLQDVTDDSNTQAAFKSQEVTEEVLMRVLSVYPVRPSRQPMNNRHCGSILWILNQWRWERALANTYGSLWWVGGWRTLEWERILQILHLYLCTVRKAGLSIDAAHFRAGVFSFYRWQTGCLCTEVLLWLQVLHINRPQTGTQRSNPEMSYDVRAALLSAGGLTRDCLVFTHVWILGSSVPVSWSGFFFFFFYPASDCLSNLIQGHAWKWSL